MTDRLTPPPPQAAAERVNAVAAATQEDEEGVHESRTLLNGRKFVLIRHNGETYRLQATRLGKLILTK
jgi:hemin uptake protein HemP